jgi:hypothetical protein
MPLTEESPLDAALTRIIGEPSASAGDIQLSKPSLLAYMPGAFDWKKQAGTTAKAAQTGVTPQAGGVLTTSAASPATKPPVITQVPSPIVPATTPNEQAAAANQAAAQAGSTNPLTPLAPVAPVAAAPTGPVNPGAYTAKIANSGWQAQQQYWKDLDTYNKANNLGAYKA